MVLPTVLKKFGGNFFLPVINRIRAGQPEGLKEFGRFQKDTKTDELMMEDLGKYVIKTSQGGLIGNLAACRKG